MWRSVGLFLALAIVAIEGTTSHKNSTSKKIPLPKAENNSTVTNLAKLPCCRDGIGDLACVGLRKSQPDFFEKRCLTDHDFHTTLCCLQCRDFIETHKISPESAQSLFKAPPTCRDQRSPTFCNHFKNNGIGKYSCKDALFAMRMCRESCGYCDDSLYDYSKAMPPCGAKN